MAIRSIKNHEGKDIQQVARYTFLGGEYSGDYS